MLSSFKVDVSPDMGMYRMLQSQSYSAHSALSEFVDNSVQSYIDKKEAINVIDKHSSLEIKISIDSKKREIIISDNASGINRENFQKAIKMGTDTAHKKTSLSKFGVGMKTAAVWLSNTWTIETSALYSSEKLICKFDLENLLRKNETEIPVSRKEEREELHYTKITITNSKRMESKEYYQDKLIPHLAETFIKFKDFLSIEVKYDGDILPQKWKKKNKAYFEPPEPLEHPEVDKNGKPKSQIKKIWKQRVELTYQNKTVKGFFIIMKTGSYSQPGVRLFRNRRVIQGTIIEPNRPKILLGTENKYASQRLYGEIHLDDFDVDFMKTKFSDDLNPIYLELKKELQKEKFIDQVNFYRSRIDIDKGEKNETGQSKTKRPGKEAAEKEAAGKTRVSRNITKIQKSEKISLKLSKLKNKKLERLYNSLCSTSLVEHPYLCYIGNWAFLEVLSVYMGNAGKKRSSFESFFGGKINEWYPDRDTKKTMMLVIKDINLKGNASKHALHEFSEAKQLKNNFNTLEDFIIECIDSIQEN